MSWLNHKYMIRIFLLPIIFIFFIVACNTVSSTNALAQKEDILQNVVDENTNVKIPEFTIDTLGQTISTRFIYNDTNFVRPFVQKGSFADYLRNLPLKPHGSVCHYYDGGEKRWEYTAAVVDMSIDNEDLQQCADAVMRLRGEYLYANKQYDKMHFNFTNGFCCDFKSWAEGKRVGINGNKTWWRENAAAVDYSYTNFRKWMKMVFYYAGTLSLSKELKHVALSDVQIGDVLIRGGSPGHCEIIVDMLKNEKTGEVKLMLAQSYMPAQEIEILYTEKFSPWYSVMPDQNEIWTMSWDFSIDQIMRFAE